MTIMTMYRGWERQTEVVVDVEVLACGAGRITCPECGGDGDWKKFLNEEQVEAMCPGDTPYRCIECKGTGKILVSV